MIYSHLRGSFFLILAGAFAGLFSLSACSINVKKTPGGEDKKVDIETPFGGIHVDKNADARDTGLTVYPGAHPVEKEAEGNEKSANVNITAGIYGIKVVAVEYESADTPEKVIAYYKDQLKKFGPVLECRTTYREHAGGSATVHSDDSGKDSNKLTCDSGGGNDVELKVGTKENQHIVAVQMSGKGTKFALVLVQVRGKETI